MNVTKAPLAHLVRPRKLEEFVGQGHLVGEGKPITKLIDSGALLSSIIFWGPPGCGKTTLAKLMAELTRSEFVEMSAVSANKADVQKAINRAKLLHTRIVLFLDEIHRFNKAQQDFLLPFVERGVITLIGATTENPSFEVISALLSRSRVFVLNQLSEDEIGKIVVNALGKQESFEWKVGLSEDNCKLLAKLANGDARSALNILELASSFQRNVGEISEENILQAAQKSHLRYDKDGEEHYNIISALHKSMRDSDANAAVYWTMRMIEGGEDPKYIIRRLIRFASEDIGNADPQALVVACAAKDAVEFLGYPECDTALVQAATYLARAKKSNSVYRAVSMAREDIGRTGNLPVPFVMRNAPTGLMKDLGYGKGYKYAHSSSEEEIGGQERMPEELRGKKYYDSE